MTFLLYVKCVRNTNRECLSTIPSLLCLHLCVTKGKKVFWNECTLPSEALALIIWLNITIKPLFLLLYSAEKKTTELTSQVILTRPFISCCFLRNVFPLSFTLPKELYFYHRWWEVIDLVKKTVTSCTARYFVKHLQFNLNYTVKNLKFNKKSEN